jgi:long-chain acyl-CoA synthetase
LGPDDRVLVCLPICFSYAFVAQVLASFLSGATLFMSSPPFSADSFAGALREHRITSTSLTPYLVRRLTNAGVEFPEGLRVLTVGGDALSVPLVRRLLEARPGRELYVTYGLTEAGPRVSTLSAHAEPPSKWHTVGLPLSGVRVRVRGGEGERCGPLSVQTPSAMLRRVGPVERHRGRDGARPDGWLETGDVFCRDEDGYLSFVGRSSEFVVINGEKVCLSSVRRVAQESVWVSKAATQVIKEGDEVMGYRLVLHLHPSVKPGQLDLRSVVRRLRFAERPSEVTVVESTPEGQYK